MFRWSRRHLGLVILGFAVAAGPILTSAPAGAADDVAVYLEERGLLELLALHLESQIEEANAEDREVLAARLAELYARLLERATDPARRQELEARSRDLLRQFPTAESDSLRIALASGIYARIERIAEDHRIRASSPEEVEDAKAMLDAVIPELRALAESLDRRWNLLDRRLGRAVGGEAASLLDEIERLEALAHRARFLMGWALFYQAWLNDVPGNALAAETAFVELLDPAARSLRPAEVSRDLLAEEPFARAVLGIALTKSLTSTTATALEWVDLLEPEAVAPAVREQVPAWRLAILLEDREFRLAEQLLEEHAAEGEVPATWIRLAAVHAIEHADRSTAAAELAREAVAEFAARGELQQVLDLAERYGTDVVAPGGFAGHYVRGARAYNEAREAHGEERPTTRPELRSMYEAASASFEAALAAEDAARYPAAAAGCRLLRAWCAYFAGEFLDARASFEAAASAELPPAQREEALWMAIVSLEQIARAGEAPEVSAELDRLVDRFVEDYPDSDYTPRLVLRQASRSGGDAEATVERLLEIPRSSPTYHAARLRASQLRYELFRAAGGNARRTAAEAFLDVASPLLLEVDRGAGGAAAAIVPQDALTLARQILDAALAAGVDRVHDAEAALAYVEAHPEVVRETAVEEELSYQRVRLRLARADFAAAAEAGRALWESSPTSRWATAAARAIFRRGHDRWRERAAALEEPDTALLRLLVEAGGRVLRDLEAGGRGVDDRAAAAYFVAVAGAARALWEATGDADAARQADLLYDRLLEAYPRNAELLHAGARLAEATGARDDAIDRWRRLAAGHPEGSEAWYESKYHFLRLLSEMDPDRARQVLNQHRTLHPELAPEPWRERYLELEALLGEGDGASDEVRENDDADAPSDDEPESDGDDGAEGGTP